MTMEAACRDFREEWERGDAGSHASRCPECARWIRVTERVIAALERLERPQAPPELAGLVAHELAGDRSRRLERVLSSLVRQGAPAALDERVAEVLMRARAGEAEHRARALRALEAKPAPNVLERLLREELEAPERQRVERFSGSLERVQAPAVLAERLGSAVRRRALVRLVLGPLATLAAAGLVVWITVINTAPEQRSRRFQVVEATSLETLDPLARALAESLSGGAGAPR
jgi:hypothetical protein